MLEQILLCLLYEAALVEWRKGNPLITFTLLAAIQETRDPRIFPGLPDYYKDDTSGT